MAVIVTDLAELIFLRAVQASMVGTWEMALLQSNGFVFGDDAILDDILASEADFDGYAREVFEFDTFATIAHVGTATAPDVSFVRASTGAPQTIYGWFVVATFPGDAATLMWGDYFGTPRVVENENDTLTITPRFTANTA